MYDMAIKQVKWSRTVVQSSNLLIYSIIDNNVFEAERNRIERNRNRIRHKDTKRFRGRESERKRMKQRERKREGGGRKREVDREIDR